MKKNSLLTRVRAAHALSVAMTDGFKPTEKYLSDLGLPVEFGKRFKR